MKSGSIIAFILISVVIVALFLPQIRQAFLKLRSETITLDTANAAADPGVPNSLATLDIITILGKDGIPAILDPRFVTVEQAQGNMKPPGTRPGGFDQWGKPGLSAEPVEPA